MDAETWHITIVAADSGRRARLRRLLEHGAPWQLAVTETEAVAAAIVSNVGNCSPEAPSVLLVDLAGGEAHETLAVLRAMPSPCPVVAVWEGADRALRRAAFAAGVVEIVEDCALTAGALIHAFECAIERTSAWAFSAATEAHFRELVDALPQLVWIARPDGVVEYFNSRAAQYAGIERQADGTWLWHPLVHPEDSARTLEAWAHARASGEVYSIEHRVRMAQGYYRWHLSRAVPARSAASGAVTRWFGTATDIHELKTAAQAARENEERFQLVGRATNDVIWDWDLKSHQIAWNDAVLETFGATRAEFGGSLDAWAERLHPGDRERVCAGLFAVIDGGAESWQDEYRFRRNDGSYATILDRGFVARDERGTPYRMVGSMLDVSARRQSEEALREADRRKDAFLAMLAHELRNPLAPIRNAVQIMRTLGGSSPELARTRAIVDRQVTHLSRIIDDLLDVSRIARGRIALHKEPCDLVENVRQTVEDYRADLEARGLEVAFDAPPGPICIEGDPTRLTQIVGNLLHNAGKFTHRGDRIAVRIAPAADGVTTLSVSDTGIGIDPVLLPHIFDVFAQADQGIDRSSGGLGLGLALVRGLTELHGGSVSASSEGPGRGATFTLRLPVLTARRSEAATPPPAAAAREPASHLRVLVVEDNRDAAETLQMLLSLAGHQVRVAYDGRSGIEQARALHPDLVICDIGLPDGTNGYDVARALRADDRVASAFLVALTGYGRDEDRRNSREAGFDAHLVKPVDIDALEALIERVPHRD